MSVDLYCTALGCLSNELLLGSVVGINGAVHCLG